MLYCRCAFDTRIVEKQTEKIDHYQDLKGGSAKDLELQKCSCHPELLGL